LDDQEGQVEVLQNGVDDRGCGISERPAMMLSTCAGSGDGISNQIHNNRSGQPERGQHKPGEEDREHVVDQLNVEEEHADKVVTTLVPVGEKLDQKEGWQ
jgi:hypothetical protein